MTMTSTITDQAPPAPSENPDSLVPSLPGWGRPRTPLPGPGNPDPLPATEDSGRATAAAGDGSGSSGHETASIQAFFKGRAKSYAKIAGTLFKAVGGLLNSAAAEASGTDTDAWLPDEEDLDTVPPPLGRIAARRIKFGADPAQLSDVEDIGMAAVGLLMWAAKGVAAVAEARRQRRRLEADKAVYSE